MAIGTFVVIRTAIIATVAVILWVQLGDDGGEVESTTNIGDESSIPSESPSSPAPSLSPTYEPVVLNSTKELQDAALT